MTMHGVMDIAIGRCRDYAWGYGGEERSLLCIMYNAIIMHVGMRV